MDRQKDGWTREILSLALNWEFLYILYNIHIYYFLKTDNSFFSLSQKFPCHVIHMSGDCGLWNREPNDFLSGEGINWIINHKNEFNEWLYGTLWKTLWTPKKSEGQTQFTYIHLNKFLCCKTYLCLLRGREMYTLSIGKIYNFV